MAAGNRFRSGGRESFYQSGVLPENNAARFASAAFLDLFERIFEIALGVLLLIPKFTCRAAWGIIALLIAVYPANIYMALNVDLFPEFNPALVYLRLPLQFVMIAWAFGTPKLAERCVMK
jgi:uncharacterized membrane protein